MFTPPPRVFGPCGHELRDVMARGVVAFVEWRGYAEDDVASIRLDLSEVVVLTASTELLDDGEIEDALGMLPWGLRDGRA